MRTVKSVITQYKPYGIQWGVEVLFPPDKAIPLIAELAQCDVMVAGCDLWRYYDKSRGLIISLLGAGIDIENYDELSPKQAAQKVILFLDKQLPEDAELISLILIDMEVYNLLSS